MSRFTVDDIRSFRPSAVEGVARRLEHQRRLVASAMGRLLAHTALGGTAGLIASGGTSGAGAGGGGGGSSSGSWGGSAAGAAEQDVAATVDELATLATALGASAQTVRELGRRLEESQALFRAGERMATSGGGWINGVGEVMLPERVPTGVDHVDALAAANDALTRDSVAQSVAAARAVAIEADLDARRRLSADARGDAAVSGPPDVSLLAVPPAGRGPGAAFQSAAWWRSLTVEERSVVIRSHPEWVGPRDGVPAADRHQANLLLLARAERDAQAELRAAEADAVEPGFLGPDVISRLQRARERVEALRAVRSVIGQHDGETRRLLLVDPSGPVPLVATCVGDPDSAGHVATWVGGFTTTPGDDLARMDQTFVRMRQQATAMTRESGAAGEVAIVTWMGYPAPQTSEVLDVGDRSVLSEDTARQAAGPLAAFVEGVDASRRVPPHQTLWAHSYGTLTAAYSLPLQRRVDDVALFGSPGTPLTSTTQAGLKSGAINVLAAEKDVITYTGWFGNNPARTPDFVQLATTATLKPGTNVWLGASHGHSEYLLPGSTSEYNLAALAAGRADLRVFALAR